MSGKPSLRYRRIGAALRDLRDARGLTVATAARKYGRSQGWFSTVENGLTVVRSDELSDLLDFYQCEDGELRESLLYLASRDWQRGWWRAFARQVPMSAIDFVSFEADSAGISVFEKDLVPGLLQNEDYARAVNLGSIINRDSDQVEESVAFRMARKQVLDRPVALKFDVIVCEAALRQEIGGKSVMRAQLETLIRTYDTENISVRVIPYSAGAHAGAEGSFSIYDVGNRGLLSLVLIDGLARTHYLEDDQDVALYRRAFQMLSATALTRSESAELMRRIASEL
jgi:transcriptional regulator with XRE-family HTH domain